MKHFAVEMSELFTHSHPVVTIDKEHGMRLTCLRIVSTGDDLQWPYLSRACQSQDRWAIYFYSANVVSKSDEMITDARHPTLGRWLIHAYP